MATRSPNKFTQQLGWAGGVNLLADPKAIRDDQLANGKNCWPTKEGILAKRQALAFERVAIKNPDVLYKPIAMFVPDPITGFEFVIHYADQFGSEYIRAGSFDRSLGADCPFVQVAAGGPLSYRPMSFANYRGSVIAVGAGNEGFYQLTLTAATGLWAWHKVSFSWTTFDPLATQSQAVAVKPRTVGVYRDRLVFADFGPGMGHWLVMADRVGPWAYQTTGNDDAHRDAVPLWSQVGPDVLLLNGRHVEIVALQGQSILSVEEIATASIASALQRALMVRTATRANVVTGEIAESTDTGTTYSSYLGDWVPADVNIDAGIAGPHCHCRGPNGIFWANGEDVYALYDGAPRPVVIGTNIRPALQACPKSFHGFWHMAYADGAVYLSVATQNSTNELNLAIQHWRLDVRPVGDGDETAKPMGASEARWWGPQDYEHILGLDVTNDSSASMGCCIVSRRGQSDQNTVYGMVMMDGNNNGGDIAKYLFLVSFNRVTMGHDAPFPEILTGRQWTANEAVVVGDVLRPSPLVYDGFLYAVTVAGVTGGAEPVWPGTGAGFASGTATLREISSAADASQFIGRTPTWVSQDTDAWRIPMEADFKELSLGSNMVDKVFVKADIAAFMDVKQQIWLDVLGNGGDLKMHMGPAVMGDFTLGRLPAQNDLGLMQLDVSSLAKNFQSRRLSPNDSSRDKIDTIIPGVVRARTLQPCLREGQGLVIDDSNDHIAIGRVEQASPPADEIVFSVALVQGYYANIDAVLAHIVAQLIAANIAPSLHGITWTTTSAYTNGTPYTSCITMTTPGGTSFSWCFLFAADGDQSVDVLGNILYLQRSMRLMTLLGFDTSSAYTDAYGQGQYVLNDAGIKCNFLAPAVALAVAVAQPIFGIQAVPYVNSPVVAITELKGTFVRKSNQPIGTIDRQS